MEQYSALIVDLKGSKSYRINERNSIQELLKISLSYLNVLYGPCIVKPMMFSGGDEVQGLFYDPVAAFLSYRMLSLIIGANAIRGGIGIGEWNVRLDSEGSASQDGSAYHNARQALRQAKGSKQYDIAMSAHGQLSGYLTILIDHSIGICKKRTFAQDDAALLVEIMRPLVVERCIGLNDDSENRKRSAWEHAMLALSFRERTMHKSSDKLGLASNVIQSHQTEIPKHFRAICIDEQLHPGWDLVASHEGDLRGLSYELSEISGMTRQGLDRHISRGCVMQERNAVVALALAMRQQVWW